MIFDTHCHLNDENIYKNIDTHIKNAFEVGVKCFLVVGYDKKSSLLAVEIANKYPNCYAAIGFHPTEIFNLSDADYNETLMLYKNNKVKAIGEIGLDYHWNKEAKDKELQKQYFVRQIEFANKVNLPVSIHNRDGDLDCYQILKEHTPKCGFIMHCYSGSVELMKELIKLGAYISLGGPVTFTNAKTPKEVAIECPINRLLVETDCPYLTPHPFRGQPNEPKYIRYVVDELAKLRNVDKEELEKILYQNSKDILKI